MDISKTNGHCAEDVKDKLSKRERKELRKQLQDKQEKKDVKKQTEEEESVKSKKKKKKKDKEQVQENGTMSRHFLFLSWPKERTKLMNPEVAVELYLNTCTCV